MRTEPQPRRLIAEIALLCRRRIVSKSPEYRAFSLTPEIKGLRFAQDMNEPHLEKRPIGYARVSTYGQILDSQLEQLRKAGYSSRSIYREKVTGGAARPAGTQHL